MVTPWCCVMAIPSLSSSVFRADEALTSEYMLLARTKD